jgi:hypothetical protein
MSFWLVMTGIDVAMGGYVAYLWAHGHVALLQGPPHGLGGHGFLAYLATVAVLTVLTVWVLMGSSRRAFKVWVVVLDLAALYVDLRVLSDPQQQFTEWAVLVALLTNFILFVNLQFWVIGPLLEGRGSASSLEVER